MLCRLAETPDLLSLVVTDNQVLQTRFALIMSWKVLQSLLLLFLQPVHLQCVEAAT